jgi:hypothetical protein
MHAHAWISTEGLPGVLETARGTLAGTSLADIMYGVLMRRVLGRCREALAAEGLVEVVDTPQVGSLFGLADGTCGVAVRADDISYVDDAVSPVFAPAQDICFKLRSVASIAHSCFRRFGLVLNYKRGEALIQWAGKGMALARLELVGVLNSQIAFVSCGCEVVLQVARYYKHLGTRTAASGHMGPEVSATSTTIKQVVSSMRRRIFCKRGRPCREAPAVWAHACVVERSVPGWYLAAVVFSAGDEGASRVHGATARRLGGHGRWGELAARFRRSRYLQARHVGAARVPEASPRVDVRKGRLPCAACVASVAVTRGQATARLACRHLRRPHVDRYGL